MERARATWTDERLDDLSRSVDRIDADVRQFRAEMNARFDGLEGRIGNRIDGLDGRIDGLQRTLIQVGGRLTVAVLATLATVLATLATVLVTGS